MAKVFFNKMEVEIPEGWYDISDDSIVKKGDQIALVAFHSFRSNSGVVSWEKPSEDELDKLKKYSGKIVIRKMN